MSSSLAFDEMTQAIEGAQQPVKRVSRDQYAPAEQGSKVAYIGVGPRIQFKPDIEVSGRRYLLKGIFIVRVESPEPGLVLAEHKDLPVDGYGVDREEALDAFNECFDLQYKSLVEVDPESLTDGGLARRAAMERAVREVIIIEE